MYNRLFLIFLLSGSIVASCKETPKPAADVYYKVKLQEGIRIDSIVVNKATREMQVFSNQRMVKKYKVRLGLNPVGPKRMQGDYKTPEGLYYINLKNANSQFHKGLGISYPNKQDKEQAKLLGKSPGGDVIIHGLPNNAVNTGPGHYENDWTWGCIALSNEEVDELFEHVTVGVPILIKP